MGHIINRGRYGRETYPSGTPPNFGIPNEIVREYFAIGSDTTPGATFSPFPWSASNSALAPTNPPAITPEAYNFIIPVPPCALDTAALITVSATGGGAITGDPIPIQWRGIFGNNPVIAIPAPAIGASQQFIDVNTLGALPAGTITITNFDFSGVVVPLGGATIFPDLAMPENLVVPVNSAFLCFFAFGIDWNPALINAPFGP